MIEIPLRAEPQVRAAIAALAGGVATEQQQLLFWRYLLFDLCKLTSVEMTLPASAEQKNWESGWRGVACYLEAQRAMPADDPPPAPGRPRTATEAQRRRNQAI